MTEPSSGAAAARWRFAHALLFTGHMIDRPERVEPRFPARAEGRARAAIREAIAAIQWSKPGVTIGLAGGASGGDLLFHEVCAELGIGTWVLLARQAAEFIADSVAPAGAEWERRFHALLASRGPENVKFLGPNDGLLEGRSANVWQRANHWILEQALALAPERTLLALWDRKSGDGPGGTEHFVEIATRFGVRVAPVIEMRRIVSGQDSL
jgi:hypothetical protein